MQYERIPPGGAFVPPPEVFFLPPLSTDMTVPHVNAHDFNLGDPTNSVVCLKWCKLSLNN